MYGFLGHCRGHPSTGLLAGTPTDGFWGRTISSRGGFGSFARQILPSSLQGGFRDFAVLEIWGEKPPGKKSFDETASFLWNFDFFAFLGFWGAF